MVILTFNCGSSSAKYQVYDWAEKRVLAVGLVERIGESSSNIEHSASGKEDKEYSFSCPSHVEAIQEIIKLLTDKEVGCIHSLDEVKATGHRVVHGGETFTKSTVITREVLQKFKDLEHLAPLHNPANILGILAANEVLPNIPHVAVLDTAWHQTMPDHTYLYALPYEWYTKYGVRRYGFHGSSYVYTAKRAAVLLGKDPKETNLVIAHIGNGASMCAVKNGTCYDTSMGFTPLEGLVMGTRSGDMDPAIIAYMMKETGMSIQDIDKTLNKESGLKGLTGYTDRRDIRDRAESDPNCATAIKVEGHRLKKYIGAYMAAVGKIDAIVLTAGVGEMAGHIRKEALSDLEHLGIELDLEKNDIVTFKSAETCISKDSSPVKIFIIPTDEELVMTEDTAALVDGTYDVHTNFTYSFQNPAYVNYARAEKLEEDLKKDPRRKTVLAIPPQK